VPSITNFAVWHCGYQMKDVVRDADRLAECMVRCCEEFEFDGLEFVLDTAVSPETLGAKVTFRDDETATCTGGAITSYAQVMDLPITDPHKDGRIPIYLEAVERMHKRLGDHVLIVNSIGQAPFSFACMVRGMEDFLLDLHVMKKDLSPIQSLIEHCELCLERIAAAYAETGTHMVYCGDALASFDVVSPKIYETMAYPTEKKLADYVRSLNLYFGIHICGDNGPILPRLVETGADMLDVDHKTDLDICHESVGDRAVVRGTLDPSSALRLGTPELVDDLSRQNIETLTEGGGRFFLNAGCDIMAQTPPENVRAMVNAARNYGPFRN
jgi:uroporphyrinogen decarboxylase